MNISLVALHIPALYTETRTHACIHYDITYVRVHVRAKRRSTPLPLFGVRANTCFCKTRTCKALLCRFATRVRRVLRVLYAFAFNAAHTHTHAAVKR